MSTHQTSLYFLGAKRTPFGAYGGSLKDLNPVELSLISARAALKQAGLSPEEVDHVIYGQVLYSTANTIYLPRHIGLKLGVPQSVPALGINRLCGTGFQVIIEAYHQMLAGDTQVALVGGVENMSLSPYLIRGTRFGLKMGHAPLVDLMTECLTDEYTGTPMAITAENLADQYKLNREKVDAYALQSQVRTKQAQEAGRFTDEISPVVVSGKKGDITIDRDEHPRPETTLESLTKLKPIFKKDGVVTAGNASGIVDGSASLVVASESYVSSKQIKPLARMVGYAVSGCDPKIMGIGPVPAIRKLLDQAGFKLDQIDLIEVNEAFSAQALAVATELKLPPDKLNVNGGAIAIGHPLAASGTRIIGHLIYELKRRGARYGLGSACIGGGQGVAILIENV